MTSLSDVRRIALALPDTAEEPHFDFISFRVRGKIFVTVPPDGEHIHVFLGEGERQDALAQFPDFTEPLHWGSKILGLRIPLSVADSGAVENLVRKAWSGKAPESIGGAVKEKKKRAPRR